MTPKSVLAMLLVLLAPIAARADYVCNAQYFPGPQTGNVFGNYGHVKFSLYTGANCSGTFVRDYFMCSAGATDGRCSASTYLALAPNHQVMSEIASQIIYSAVRDEVVSIATSICRDGSSNCAAAVIYR